MSVISFYRFCQNMQFSQLWLQKLLILTVYLEKYLVIRELHVKEKLNDVFLKKKTKYFVKHSVWYLTLIVLCTK